MKIKIIAISKNKDQYISDCVDDFTSRIKHFADIEWLYLKEVPIKDYPESRVRDDEGFKIIDSLPGDYYRVALDIQNGKMLNSVEFSQLVERVRDFEGGKICFIIGGPYGLSEQVLDVVDYKLSFSPMTFSHQVVRVMLVEQLYRALTIMFDIPYHK